MPPTPRPAIERAWAKIQQRGPQECWPWTGAHNGLPHPYGYVHSEDQVPGRRVAVHRLMFETYVGPIPPGWQIDHLCYNTLCCNPAHMEAVTKAENLARRRPRKQTHCKNGHEFTPENTAIRKNGARLCRPCNKKTQHDYYLRNRSA